MNEPETNDVVDAPQVNKPVQSESFLYLDLFILLFCSAIMIASFLMRSEGQSQVFLPGTQSAMPEICSFKRILRIQCPGCGLTRAFISISRGDLARAWSFNPASFLVYLLIAFQIPWRSFLLIRWWQKKPRVELPYGMTFVVTMAVALVTQWLVRLAIAAVV